MKSIRRYLTMRLALGLGTLWIAAGGALLMAVHHSLLAKFDTELDLLVSEVRFLMPEARHLGAPPSPSRRTIEFFVLNSGYYFEVWDADGLFSDRSPSLGGLALPRPDAIGTDPLYWNDTLASGEHVRAAAVRVDIALPPRSPAGPARAAFDVVVARNRDELERVLSLLVAGTSAVALCTAVMTALIVLPALRRGLAPLDRLGEQAAQIGPASLQSRFARSGMPVELRPITDRLNDLMGRLEDAFEREHRFSSDLAHELRTPIAEIKAMAEVALRWPDQVDTESFRDVLQTTIRMEGLLENLLAMSRLEWRAAKTERTRVNVTDLVAEAWQPQVEAAAEKHIRYTASCPPSLTTNTNASLLRVILDNLLGNAVAYTPDGGDIHVAGSLPAAGGFALTVGNAVTGVHAADLPRFFERLWRGDASRAQDPHLGLGLPLAKACAGILGLTLRAELSADESWLTFHLEPAAA